MGRLIGVRLRAIGLAAVTLASVLAVGPAAEAATTAVPCDEDALIERIEVANGTPGHDTLILAKKCTYEFEQAYSDNGERGNALPRISDDLTISGRGSKIVRDVDDALDTFAAFRILEVTGAVGDGPDVVLKDLTFTGGLAPISEAQAMGDTSLTGVGGAIANFGPGTLELHGVTVKDNEIFVVGLGRDIAQAAGLGGGIFSSGPLELHRTAVVDNEVTGIGTSTGVVVAGGGGVSGTVVLIRKSTIRDNESTGSGGQIALVTGGLAISPGFDGVDSNEGSLDMADSSVTENTAVSTGSASSAGIAGGILIAQAVEQPTVHRIARSKVNGNVAKAEGSGSLAVGGGILNVSGDPENPPDPCEIDPQDPECQLEELGGNTLFVDDPDAPGADDDDQSQINNNRASCEGVCRAVGGGYANVLGLGAATTSIGHAEFWNTVFKGNVADADEGIGQGGGLFLAGDGTAGPGDDEPETVLHDAVVTKNKVKGDIFKAGGGIYAVDEHGVDIDDSKIFKNKPDDCFNVPLCA